MPLSNCYRQLSVAPMAHLERRGRGSLGGGGSVGRIQHSFPEGSHFIQGAHPFFGLLSQIHPGKALVQEVESLLQKGAIELAPLPSLGYYSRLFVVMKASGSWRPVIDLSCLNLKVLKTPFKMETLQSTLLSVCRGDWMVSIDLKDAYLQIPIHPESRKYLRFMAFEKVYQFKVLCFGLSTAPQVFTWVMAPVSAILHSLGIRLRRYLDDWLIQASSREQVLLALRTVLRLCNSLGIVVNWEKSQLVPTQTICYLGVILDSINFRASPAQKRVDKLLSIGDMFLSSMEQPAKSWLELLEVLSSLTQLIPGGRLWMRSFQFVLHRVWDRVNPDSLVRWSPEIYQSSLVVELRTALARNLPRAGVSPARLVVRRLGCRLGGSPRRPSRFRPLVSRGAPQLHKSLGAASNVLCSTAFSSSSSQHLSGSVCGQYHCSGLPEESGRYQICSPETDGSGSAAVGGAPLCHTSSAIYYGPQQRVSGCAISPKSDSGLPVDLEALDFSTASEEVASGNRSVCSLSQSPLHIVTHPLYESRMHWIPDPTPSLPRRTGKDLSVKTSDSPVPIPSDSVRPHDAPVKVSETSDTQASAIAMSVPSGAPLTPSLPRKCRRRRRRKARMAANEKAAPGSAAPVTPDERWANENTGIPGATQLQPEASDPTQMGRTAVYPGSSIHSHPFTQPPISTANENSALPLGLELCKFPDLYKPAVPDLRQDLTARPFRVNNSGSSLSSPPHLQPYTKPFSGRPARPYMTCPT